MLARWPAGCRSPRLWPTRRQPEPGPTTPLLSAERSRGRPSPRWWFAETPASAEVRSWAGFACTVAVVPAAALIRPCRTCRCLGGHEPARCAGPGCAREGFDPRAVSLKPLVTCGGRVLEPDRG